MKKRFLSMLLAAIMVLAIIPMSAITTFAADEVPVTGVNFTMSYAEIPTGEAMGFSAEVLPENATNKKVTYTSSDYSVAVVDPSTGKITGVKSGTATITATSQDGNFTDTVEVKVIDGLGETNTVIFYGESITSPYETQTVGVGNKLRQPAVAPTKEGHVFCGWYTSWECVAPWDFDNTVGTGFYRIYAKFVAEADYVEVSGLSLSVASFAYDLKDNAIYPLTAKAVPENASETPIIKWSVSDPSVVEITENSSNQIYFKGLKPGTATITASTKDGAKSASCEVTVTDSRSLSLQSTASMDLADSDTLSLSATLEPNDTYNDKLTWTVDDPSILEIEAFDNDTVILHGLQEGVVTVTVSTKDGAKSASCVVTVIDTLIESLEIYITPPIAGQSPATTATTNNVHVSAIVDGWYPNVTTFEEGKIHTVVITVKTETGYTFPKGGVIVGNPSSFKINGETASVQTVDYENRMQTLTLTYYFEVLPPHTHTYTNSVIKTDADYHWLECDAADCPDLRGSIKDKAEHTCSTDFKTDANYHWKECACGVKSEYGAHSESTPATCIAKATCVCGQEIGDFGTHTFATDAWNEEVPATCVATGTKAHKDCSVCHKHFAADGVTEITDLTIAIDTTNHDMATEWTKTAEEHYHVCKRTGCEYHDTLVAHTSSGSATETTPETCTVCGYIITPALGHTTHTAKSEWKSDADNHWHECTGCEGQQLEKAAHADTNNDEKCDTCGYDMPASGTTPGTTPGTDDPNTPDDDKDGLGAGAIVAIVIGSVAVAGVGGFAIFWFVIKKKTWAEFLAIFKKNK